MAATTQSSLRSSIPNYQAHQSNNTIVAHSQLPPHHQPNQPRRNPSSKQRFLLEFSQCLVDFVVQLLPTVEELAVKEDVRKLLERLIRTIEPESRLLSFGSTANGFSLRNSDMDLCCLIDSDERTTASNLVTLLGDLLERETKFHVKPLPHARIPIVKLTLDPSPGLPFGIACDIGFENRLALENTRLLMCYAMIDPARVRTMVLFLKVWSKRRRINSPYHGTLSSYGYVLLVLYFLIHVKNPPVLPNLQQMSPIRPVSKEEIHLNGFNIWFFDDIELLRQRWQSANTETVAELLIDFFKYFSREFSYSLGVASIRAGLLKKESKGWSTEPDPITRRERNRFGIEDPFETDFNVARCVTKEGLFVIRGEFMRASRVFSARPERAIVALAQLCEERKDDEIVQPDGSNQTSPFIPPRMSPAPAQTSYTVGGSPARLNADAAPHVPQFVRNLAYQQQAIAQRLPTLPEHATADHPDWNDPMGAPNVIRSGYTDGLDCTYLPNAVHGVSNDVSSDTSDVITDDEMMEAFLDSVDDVRSYTDESLEFTRASSPASSQLPASSPIPPDSDDIPKSPSQALLDNHLSDASGSKPNNTPLRFEHVSPPLIHLEPPQPAHVIPSRIDTVKRVTPEHTSLSALTIPFGYIYSSSASRAYYHRQSASSSSSPHFSNPGHQRQQSPQHFSHHQSPQTVFYETTGPIPFKHSNHINHLSHCNDVEPPMTYPYHYAYYSASPLHLRSEHPPQQQQHYVGPIPGPSRQSVFGAGGESTSVKSLPQHVLSARKRNSRRNSMSDGSNGKLSWKEVSGSTNGNTRSNTPTTSSMTPPPHPRSLSREGSNSSRPPSRTQRSHSNSSVTVKSGTKQHQHGGHGQGIQQQQQSYRLHNGSVPSSPIVHQDPSSPSSSPLQQQHQLPSPSTSKPHLRKDPGNSPLSGIHLNSPRRGSSGQLSNPQGDVSNDEVLNATCNSRTTGSPCASVSNGSATTGSAIDSSPGSISSTSSSLQSAFNRSMTDDSGFEVVSPFQSRIGRLPPSQHEYVVRRNGDGGVTTDGVSEEYRMMRQNLQELRTQKERSSTKDWQTLQGGRSDPVGVQQGVDSQAQLQSEENTRRIRQAWKEYQARRVVDGNGVVYHQPQMGMTVDTEGRKVLAVGEKHGKKW
ncbi:hypothetical protein BDM02DRAFT_1762344 [Thelephora ganbajun]|uniref:Uncharacterized protein n=1 Tax=Thelephora ganbajun TaxID=370292 RepID=A0ACB6ZJ50_THEGA|nr:hypothetical protein BDM02DRAFT_1762344 [Thelephora ganbajun]